MRGRRGIYVTGPSRSPGLLAGCPADSVSHVASARSGHLAEEGVLEAGPGPQDASAGLFPVTDSAVCPWAAVGPHVGVAALGSPKCSAAPRGG